MIGHRQIIALRQQGYKPAAVFVEAGLDPHPQRFEFEKYENALLYKTLPAVHIPADELTMPQDFRFLVGCTVHIHGKELSDEVLGLADRIVQAGAAHVVVAALEQPEILEHKNGEWIAHAN